MPVKLHYVIGGGKAEYYSGVISCRATSDRLKPMRFRLLEFRRQAGFTQAQVANHIGISQGLYAQLESGKRRMNETYLEALADPYGISPSQLIVDPVRNDPLFQELDDAYRLLSPAERKILVSSARGIAAGRLEQQ